MTVSGDSDTTSPAASPGAWPTLADVMAARRAIAGVAIRTPLVPAAFGGGAPPLWLKLETLQPSGAFKLRGAANAIAALDQARRSRGVVCSSTGNHGRGVAFAARRQNVPATVCLSRLVPDVKVRAIETWAPGSCATANRR